MGHKYNRRDGTWRFMYRFNDTTTLIRTCPKCNYSQPLDVNLLQFVKFDICPRCKAKLDIPKKIG